jgi:hypothetical protein
MHNSIPEYASTTNISTTPTFHIHGVKFCFLLEYFQKSLSSSSNKEAEQKRKKRGRKKISVENKRERRAPKV